MSIIEAVPHRPEADSFQFAAAFGHLKQAVIARVWVVVFTTVVSTALVCLYLWIWPPTFQAEVMIGADSEKDLQRSTFYAGWNVFRREGLVDEAAMMTSPPVLKEVVRRLDLKYDDVYHPFMSYVTHLWGQSWIGQNYRKVKYWFFPRKPGPYELTPEEIERYKVLADFRDSAKVEQVKDAAIGLMIVKASSQRVAEIANTIINVYLEQRRERQIREAQQARDSLSEEVDKVQSQLESLDSRVLKFRNDKNLFLQFEKDKVQVTQYQAQQAAVAELEADIADKENALASVNRNLENEGESIDSSRVFKDSATQERLARLEAQLAQSKQLFQPNAPEVRELEEQIRIGMAGIEGKSKGVIVRNSARVGESYEILRTRKFTLESQLAGGRAALRAKRGELARMRASVEEIPGKMMTNHEFDRQQIVLESKLQALHDKLAVATVSFATAKSAPSAVRVIEYASPPEQPVWPNTKLFILVAILSGLLLGSLAALFLELAFVRVSRYRLWEKDSVYRVFAIVDQDERFLDSLYVRPPPLRLIGKSETA